MPRKILAIEEMERKTVEKEKMAKSQLQAPKFWVELLNLRKCQE